jgi:hypothetical protein
MGRQRPLDLHRAQHRLLRAGERREERVPLRIHLAATQAGDGRPHQPPVLGQHLRVPIPQSLDQPRRPLDIGEHEGDRPARKPAHPTVPQPSAGRSRPSPAHTAGTTPAGHFQAPGATIEPPPNATSSLGQADGKRPACQPAAVAPADAAGLRQSRPRAAIGNLAPIVAYGRGAGDDAGPQLIAEIGSP